MTTKEVADGLGVTLARVRQLIYTKTLEAEKKGRDWLVTRAAFEEFAARDRGAGKKYNQGKKD